jgi:hypothetical protein
MWQVLGRHNCIKDFGGERGQLEIPGVDRRTIFKWILKNMIGGVDYIDLAEDRNNCRALVNTEMNFLVQ